MFMSTKNLCLVALSILLGCSSDYEITGKVEPAEPGIEAPEIEVDPVYHNYGILSAGSESQDVIVTIENIGNDDLNISSIYLHGSNSNFTLTAVPTGIIEPYGSEELIITYAPGTYETNYETVSIVSNDDDEPIVNVLLDGSGDAPVIVVTPDYHDFGTVYLGCDDTIPITIGNTGSSNLIISDIEYFASLPVDFALLEFESEWGTLPITIPPGDTIELDVDYVPLDDLDDSAYVEISSNDPATPIAYADQDGLGDYERWIIDSFTQDGEITVDILFVVDNSGSMGGNQTNLANNFDAFVGAFSAAGIDYHLAIITTDSAAFVGDMITPSTADPITEFNDQISSIGTRGSALEQGLYYSYLSTSSGGDASPGATTGFFRPDSRLVVVYISDEPDASHYSSSMADSDYTAHLLSLKSSTDLVVAHAVIGDYPSGCSTNGGAQFGDGYYDVANDLGGTVMSICAEDWSVTMDTLARDSMAEMAFALSDNPIEETITVTIDGVTTTDWTYDSSSNMVNFSVAPDDGSAIDINYAIWAVCE